MKTIRKETSLLYPNEGALRMICSPQQGHLLTLFTQLKHPQLILEVGTFTGYSAACLAKGLTGNQSGGCVSVSGVQRTLPLVISCESNSEAYITASRLISESPVSKQVIFVALIFVVIFCRFILC